MYDSRMSPQDRDQAGEVPDETLVDERGVRLSRAAVDHAGSRLAEVRARHTREYFAALRDRLGIRRRPP
jgi:hypothetical protein